MLEIPCPCCGNRPHSEFVYDGDALVMPLDYSQLDTPQDQAASYVYDRRNIRGIIQEYWHHQYGCRQWLVVKRDSFSHEITGASLLSKFKRTVGKQ